MSLSVLTLVRNREGHLAQLVEGLRRSVQAPDELIVVDMGDVVLPVPDTVFRTSVIRLATEGLPLAEARNLAAGTARSEQLLFLDVDCIPMRGLVGAMAAALRDHDALICAHVRYLAVGDARGDWNEEGLSTVGLPHPARAFPTEGLAVEPNAGLFWSLAFGVRRERFEAQGGFDERFTGYGAEDTDFGFRARDAGLPLMVMGGPGVFHQHHGVIDPPLQHFDDILRNARTFHGIWGSWPMLGWLKAFEAMGLIRLGVDRLERVRSPDAREIAAATKSDTARF